MVSPPPPPHGSTAPSGPESPHCRRITITFRHTTLVKTPLEEWSGRSRDFYPTINNTYNGQTSIPSAGFEPSIPASERRQSHALARVITGIGAAWFWYCKYFRSWCTLETFLVMWDTLKTHDVSEVTYLPHLLGHRCSDWQQLFQSGQI
jgi:hypothetical protein